MSEDPDPERRDDDPGPDEPWTASDPPARRRGWRTRRGTGPRPVGRRRQRDAGDRRDRGTGDATPHTDDQAFRRIHEGWHRGADPDARRRRADPERDHSPDRHEGPDRDRARGPRKPPGHLQTRAFPTARRIDVGGASGLQLRTGWPGTKRSRALVLVSMFFTAAYLGWWSVSGHVGNPVLFWMLLAAEVFNIFHLVGLWQAVWSGGLRLPPPGETEFTVDVFIPTYGEPIDVLRRTIRAAVEMDEPHHTYVLDDAVREEVRDLAERLGADYIPRAPSEGAKAGNLNHALHRTDGDLIVVFDADHVARRDFLTHLLGYFEDDSVGLVQTPQFYGNAVTNPVARGAWFQQTPFYGPILRGKHDLGAAFMCGTNAVVRREALREIGGFVEESVVEDFVTTMQLHRNGWEVVYFPYVISEGEGPTNQRAYYDQQFRWASGSTRALREGEPFKPGLTTWQRVQHVMATTFYFIGFTALIYLILPVASLIGRTGPFGPGAATFPLFYIPHAIAALLLIAYGLRWRFGVKNVQFTFGSFPIYIAGVLAGLTGREVSFDPTGASGSDQPHPLAYVTVLAFMLLMLAAILGPLVHQWDTWTAVSLFWAALDLWLLWAMVRITVRETFRTSPGSEPQLGTTGKQTTETYVLGMFERPPLPEHVMPEFEDRMSR